VAPGLLEWVSGIKGESGGGFSIAPGIVKDNLNLLAEGRVQVHVPEIPDFDPWARVSSVGGGSERGFLWTPQIGDEVLVAFNKNDARDAYVLGGLWSTMNRPPALLPTDFISKKIIKTGVKDSPLAHTIEMDDLLQSVKITTSTSQEITMDPEKIAISAGEGAFKITLDMTSLGITIESTVGDITLSAPVGEISLQALSVSIQSDVSTDISSDGPVSIDGTIVAIN
jgi:phage baseplate assembly protein gpV